MAIIYGGSIMLVSAPVQSLLNRLIQAGYSAYACGGCVRDSLMGISPHDWDICTSARPEEIEQVFSGEHLVETGIKHGTVAVVLNHVPYEITTYRLDGAYTDHRHPDSVEFVDDLREDLSRRDFTINAMACDRDGGIIDLFEGQMDLEKHTIRCVGNPFKRFEEDALRILRALRFSAVLDFTIESETDKASIEQIKGMTEQYGLTGQTKISSTVSSCLMPEILNKSSIVLVISNKSTDNGPHGIMTTKFFEALGCEKPTLCIPSDEECLESTIVATNAGLSARDKHEACKFIMAKYREWESNGYTHQLVRNKKNFTRQNQAVQFKNIFEELSSLVDNKPKATTD